MSGVCPHPADALPCRLYKIQREIGMEQHNVIIRRETPADRTAAEHLTREAFWNVYRPGCTEHYVLHVLRDDPAFVPELDLVMEREGQLIGHIMYMRARIRWDDGREQPVMTFGPLSIRPDLQRQGYGKLLLDRSMEKARELGAGALCIEGNIAVYGKSGFVEAAARGIRCHGVPENEPAPYFLVKELEEGFLKGDSGVYYTPGGYWIDEEKAEEFDRSFPPREKLKLPGQLF